MSMQTEIATNPNGRGRPKGTRNKPGHKAGRPRKPPEQHSQSVWENGKRVIRVEEEHIARAVARSSSACAIADALKQQIPNAVHVAVDVQRIRWTDSVKKIRYIALTPACAQQLIVDFDCGLREKLVPISFSLRPQFVFTSGAKRRHAPQAHELKGTGIKVPEPPEEPLARAMREDASVVAARESALDKQIARRRAPRQRRAIMSVVKPDGTIPCTVGGRAPPISALSQRSFGLRALRR
jgi:hypothetical protein